MQTLVPTAAGEARTSTFPAKGRRRALLALGHGAGGGIEAPDLRALAAALPPEGVDVVLVEQPWRVAGKRIAAAPKTLDVAWRDVIAHLSEAGGRPGKGRPGSGVPMIVGGRSAGARVACRTGLETGAAGVLALAFPLHPPGKPEKSRAEELLGSGLPTLVVQGGIDPFGAPAEFPALPSGHRLVGLPAGGHNFAVRKGQEPVIPVIMETVIEWIGAVLER